MPIITPVNPTAPLSNPPAGTTASVTQAQSAAPTARERAIAVLKGTQAAPQAPVAQEPTPVADPNHISPEELSAIKAPTATEPVEGQKDKVEATTADPAATESKEEPLSSQYALLARKEKALRAKAQQQEAAVKAREDALATREAALAAKDVEYQSNYIQKSRLTEDTLGALAEAGIDYDKLTELALNPPAKQDPQTRAYIAKLEARLSEIDGKLNKQVQSAQENQSAQYQQALGQIRKDAERLVSVGDDFEAIKTTNSISDVVELIEKTFKEDNYLMTTEEACKAVEEHLIEESYKLTQLKKIQQRLQAAKKQPEPTAQKQPEQQTKQTQMKTLTNAVGTQRQLTSKERAILAFKGELK